VNETEGVETAGLKERMPVVLVPSRREAGILKEKFMPCVSVPSRLKENFFLPLCVWNMMNKKLINFKLILKNYSGELRMFSGNILEKILEK
jgi:hypothetical protein